MYFIKTYKTIERKEKKNIKILCKYKRVIKKLSPYKYDFSSK